jgi:hypothetical protein
VTDSDTVQLRFELKSDTREQRGGWTIDDVCVVSAKPPAKKPTADAPDGGAPATEAAAPAQAADAGGSSGCSIATGEREVGSGVAASVLALAALAFARRRSA